MADRFKLILRGQAVSQDEVTDAPITAVGTALPDRSTGYVFDTDDEFQGWVREVGQEELVQRLDEATAKGREQESRTDEEWLGAWIRRRTERITADLNELAEVYGLPVDSPELLRKVMVEADPLVGSVFDPYVLFANPGCGGGFRPITGAIPKFSWIDFNNKARSYNGLGGGVLFSQYWFKAKKLYLINVGNDLGDCVNLADVNYDTMASSCIVA